MLSSRAGQRSHMKIRSTLSLTRNSVAEEKAGSLADEIDQARTALADEWEDHMNDQDRLTVQPVRRAIRTILSPVPMCRKPKRPESVRSSSGFRSSHGDTSRIRALITPPVPMNHDLMRYTSPGLKISLKMTTLRKSRTPRPRYPSFRNPPIVWTGFPRYPTCSTTPVRFDSSPPRWISRRGLRLI